MIGEDQSSSEPTGHPNFLAVINSNIKRSQLMIDRNGRRFSIKVAGSWLEPPLVRLSGNQPSVRAKRYLKFSQWSNISFEKIRGWIQPTLDYSNFLKINYKET